MVEFSSPAVLSIQAAGQRPDAKAVAGLPQPASEKAAREKRTSRIAEMKRGRAIHPAPVGQEGARSSSSPDVSHPPGVFWGEKVGSSPAGTATDCAPTRKVAR